MRYWKKAKRKEQRVYQVKATKDSCPPRIVVPIYQKSSVPVTASFRTAASVRAAAAITTSPTLWRSILVLARWRWAHESIVDVKSLIKELMAVQVLNGLAGLGESRVFNQCVSLPEELS